MCPPGVRTLGPGFCAMNQIALSHDADNLAGIVDDGNCAYAFLKQDLRYVPNSRAFAYGNHRGHHHITGLHGSLLFDPLAASLGVSAGSDLIHVKPAYRPPKKCDAQSRVMIVTIHRKSSHPAATNSMLTIRSLPYHETAAAFRLPRRWGACVSLAPSDDCISLVSHGQRIG